MFLRDAKRQKLRIGSIVRPHRWQGLTWLPGWAVIIDYRDARVNIVTRDEYGKKVTGWFSAKNVDLLNY